MAANPKIIVVGGVLFFGPDYWLATKKEQRQDLIAGDVGEVQTMDQVNMGVD